MVCGRPARHTHICQPLATTHQTVSREEGGSMSTEHALANRRDRLSRAGGCSSLSAPSSSTRRRSELLPSATRFEPRSAREYGSKPRVWTTTWRRAARDSHASGCRPWTATNRFSWPTRSPRPCRLVSSVVRSPSTRSPCGMARSVSCGARTARRIFRSRPAEVVKSHRPSQLHG